MHAFRLLAIVTGLGFFTGCMYVEQDWSSQQMADAPWVAPGEKAQWQRRRWQMFLAPAWYDEYRWADTKGRGLLSYDDRKDAKYLLAMPLAKEWRDIPSEGKLPPHKEPPYYFALVSLKPAIFIMWPRQVQLDFGKAIGVVVLYPVAWAYGISTLPPVDGLQWFSGDLSVGPSPVPMVDKTHGRIMWSGGALVLTRTASGWTTERHGSGLFPP